MGRHGAALIVLAACTTTKAAPEAGPPDVVVVAVVEAAPPPDPILGEWERKTEPYAGMRIAIKDGAGTVTAAPEVTNERLKSQTRAQLDCQKSLMKIGEEMIADIHPASGGGWDATILVRDWGFTGKCIHADSKAPAHLEVSDELTIAVTRGKVATQRWSRVR